MSMSKWNHVVCGRCYGMMYPGREPVRMKDAIEEQAGDSCCFCGRVTNEGIFVRADPDSALCKGDHSN